MNKYNSLINKEIYKNVFNNIFIGSSYDFHKSTFKYKFIE